MTFQVIVIGGVIGCFLVSSIADGIVAKGAAALAPDIRERIYQRTVKWDIVLRLVDALGFILLLVGLLGMLGYIKGGPQFAWRSGSVAVGFAVLCVERVLGSWITWHAYAKEASQQPVRTQAYAAAMLVSVAEIALAVGVCWWIFTHFSYVGPKSSSNPTQATTPATPSGTTFERSYINEKGALEILGKDKAYLDLLVKFAGIRSRTEEGITFYRKDDLTSAKEAGLPTMDEMQEALKNKPVTTNQILDAVKPLLAQGQKDAALQKVMEMTGWEKEEAEKFLENVAGPPQPPVRPPAPPPAEKTGKTTEGEALQE